MGRKGRVPQSKDKQAPFASGMLGILQSHIGQFVTISFRADAVVSEEGLMVRQAGMLIPHPGGVKNSFCLVNDYKNEDKLNEPGLVGQKPDAVGLLYFTPDVVALVGAAVLKDSLPEALPTSTEEHEDAKPPNGSGLIQSP